MLLGRVEMADLHLHDRVELTTGTEYWPAGTAGTIVDEFAGGVMVELVAPDGATLDLLDVPVSEVRSLERTAEFHAVG
jgi:Domain of unknown function (DUF4926)